MSMIVHFRPLPPDDGAEVPLDLHDPRIRQYRFKPRFIEGYQDLQSMFKDYFGWALSMKRPPMLEDLRNMVFFYFGDKAEDSELDELAQMAAEWLLDGPPEGEPTKLMRMAATRRVDPLEAIPKNEPFIPITLFATPDGRWVERRFLVLLGNRYREVNRHFAACLWRLDGLDHPGKLPPELEPYRVIDWAKIPDEAIHVYFLDDEELEDALICGDDESLSRACANRMSLNPYARTEPHNEAPADRPRLVTVSALPWENVTASALPSGNGTAATPPEPNGRHPKASTVPEIEPGPRALAAAYQLQRQGKPVSLKAACDTARVDRANLRKNYPEVVNAIKRLAAPDCSVRNGVQDRRTGNVDAIEDDEDQDED